MKSVGNRMNAGAEPSGRQNLCNSRVLSALFLAGCQHLTWSVKVRCKPAEESCEIEGEIRPKTGQYFTDLSTFDAYNVTARVTTSNAVILSSTGSMTVTLSNSGGVVATNSFSYYRSGNIFYPSSPSSINSWVHSYAGLATDVDYDYADISVQSGTGTNVFTVEILYGGQVQTGDSDSWYINPGDDGPPTDLQ